MKFNLKEKVLEILKSKPNERFSAFELSKEIIAKYPKDCELKVMSSKQKNVNIETQISAEISTRIKYLLENNIIKITDERPRKYYYSTQSDFDEINENVKTKNLEKEKNCGNEHDLYPLLIEYLNNEELIAVRIDERKSSNKKESGSNKWLYPDIVAVENLTKDWSNTTRECAKDYYIKKTKIYSYEVKKIINQAIVREAYFQAVSNSTWANFGYLVATEINQNASKELKILNSLYGIGVIHLVVNDIFNSYVYLPAKEREDMDWNIIDRLVKENSDFKKFINKISDFYRNNRNDTLEELLPTNIKNKLDD